MALRTRHKLLALLPTLALATLSAACGTVQDNPSGGGGGAPGNTQSAIPTVSKDDALAAMVPADIKSDGKILVGQDQSYPPNEFVENGQVTGMAVDLGKAVGQKLGTEFSFENAAFDGLIAGLASGRYEAAMSSFTVNADRIKEVDMVTYFTAGTSGAVLKGNPDKLTLDTLCGKNVAVQKGTVQVDDLEARTAKCKQAGQPDINVQQFQNQTDANLALTSKRVQAMLADSPVVDYAIKQTNGQLEQFGQVYDSAPYGLALPKAKGDFAKAVQGAIQSLIDDGTYKKILEKWGVQQGAITKSEVNPAPAG
ncbi:ABC transporter substrate-binding protein [Kibdelosporangium persicum]|uniref:Amino acid ABC transporter amino acid-binding protein and permease n=1 Tax=Kibdelosporangium persicum TaxID=2698649 RepID=A0ABX2EXW0_9PSEU|nr:ABC transporter substrate-binding protein [Kibdelosporangium persicum]NRN63878.1 Amino acid ABC transporter amino acid-binding protein and permease [Kibdelosporangium persicum]